MNFKFEPHTVVMMVGPTGCGKSTVAEKILYQARDLGVLTHLISSDSIRCALLDQPSVDKRNPKMQHVSKQAFSIVLNELKNLMSYPVSSELIIIDTTAMAKEFRDEIMSMTKQMHYRLDVVMFDYKNQKDYYRYLDDSENTRRTVSQAVRRFKSKVLPEMRSRDYHQIYRVKDRVDQISVEMNHWEWYKSHELDPIKTYAIIGDVHGCVDELKTVVGSLKPDDIPILVGDFIDKGPDVPGTIRFIHEHLDLFKIVLGNHENFVYKVLKGQVDRNSCDVETLSKYFDSLPLIENDALLQQMFFEIVEKSFGFLKHPEFIVTHAPCEDKYLGKIDAISLRNQRNLQRRDDINTLDQIQFLFEQAEINYPAHVFGHIAFENTFKFKNKIGCDTGCVEGNKLTVVHMFNKPFIKDVPSSLIKTKELLKMPERDVQFDFSSLDSRDRKRIHFCAKHKINFISGTVSPADKMGDDLESLQQALDYYKDLGHNTVMMQTKYMGSRCQVYLDLQNIENSYSVSRNGFLIRGDLSAVYQNLRDRLQYHPDWKMVIFDGESIPWNNPDLGAGLISKHFYPIELAMNHEFSELSNSGFYMLYDELQHRYQSSDFKQDACNMKRSELSMKYPGLYDTFKCFDSFDFVDRQTEAEFIDVYNEQMRLYATPCETHYKPFNVLKTIFADGSEIIHDDNFSAYEMITEDPVRYVDLNDDDYVANAHKCYQELVDGNTKEGVVIKPRHSLGDYAPYIKVRNPNYLSIVYGADYRNHNKYQKLLKRKSIKRKMRTSIKEFKLGYDMLKVPYCDISNDNTIYKTLVAKMIGLEMSEKELDPRL